MSDTVKSSFTTAGHASALLALTGLPLHGVTVVALEQAVSAPFATRHLADLGARVIKVERPDGGDFARAYDTLAGGLGSHFVWLNRTKESITLDVKSGPGAQVLAQLVARADVVVHNLAPGAAGRLGLDGSTLLRSHPRLVVCEISGYGRGGPYEHRRAYDVLVQSEAAVVTVTGTPDAPVKPGIAVADIAAGAYALNGVLAALLARERTGRGSVVEVAMLDAVAEWMGYSVTVAANGGVPGLSPGMSHPAIAPYDAYPTADGRQVVISVQNDREWRRLATEVLGRPDLADDPDFATNQARVAHRDRVDAAVATALATLDLDSACAALDAAGVACARINTVADLVEHPQLRDRKRWSTVGSPVGPLPTMLPPVLSSTWQAPLAPIPALGEHTDVILAELGHSPAEIAALRAAGAV
jgi:itaconate CoA-transferase